MRKIISLFQRNYDGDGLVRNEIVPGAEWVVNGEGTATRKFDGSCCLVRNGQLFKRYDRKSGRNPPKGWEPAQDAADPITGHWPGWIPLLINDPADKWHIQAWDNQFEELPDGTYELCGPKVQSNAEIVYVQSLVGLDIHVLIPHGQFILADAPRTFDALSEWIRGQDIEGIVWWHDDGRMVKIKKHDFGWKR